MKPLYQSFCLPLLWRQAKRCLPHGLGRSGQSATSPGQADLAWRGGCSYFPSDGTERPLEESLSRIPRPGCRTAPVPLRWGPTRARDLSAARIQTRSQSTATQQPRERPSRLRCSGWTCRQHGTRKPARYCSGGVNGRSFRFHLPVSVQTLWPGIATHPEASSRVDPGLLSYRRACRNCCPVLCSLQGQGLGAPGSSRSAVRAGRSLGRWKERSVPKASPLSRYQTCVGRGAMAARPVLPAPDRGFAPPFALASRRRGRRMVAGLGNLRFSFGRPLKRLLERQRFGSSGRRNSGCRIGRVAISSGSSARLRGRKHSSRPRERQDRPVPRVGEEDVVRSRDGSEERKRRTEATTCRPPHYRSFRSPHVPYRNRFPRKRIRKRARDQAARRR